VFRVSGVVVVSLVGLVACRRLGGGSRAPDGGMRCPRIKHARGRLAYGGVATANRIPRVLIGGFEGGQPGSAIGSPWRLLRAALARRSHLARAASSTLRSYTARLSSPPGGGYADA